MPETQILVGIITSVAEGVDPMTGASRGRTVEMATDIGMVTVRVGAEDSDEEFVLRSPAALPVITVEDPEFGPEFHYAWKLVPQPARQFEPA